MGDGLCHQRLAFSNVAIDQIVVVDATEIEAPVCFINFFAGDTDVVQSLSSGRMTEHLLEKQEFVTRVLYPGLESHPGYELMKKQARGFGSILTFEVDSKERAYHILENVKLIQFAESLGGTETLITYPITQTHADLSKEELDRNGITDRILRLSVGIEGAEDLIADLEAVLK